MMEKGNDPADYSKNVKYKIKYKTEGVNTNAF